MSNTMLYLNHVANNDFSNYVTFWKQLNYASKEVNNSVLLGCFISIVFIIMTISASVVEKSNDEIKINMNHNDTFTFDNYQFTIDNDGKLNVITGETLLKIKKEEKRLKYNENRKKRRRDLHIEAVADEMVQIAEDAHINEMIQIADQIQMENPEQKSPKRLYRPNDYAHRYLEDGAELKCRIRDNSVRVIYRKGISMKYDQFIAWFDNDERPIGYPSLNKIGQTIANKHGIKFRNVWKLFRRTDGSMIDKLDK